MVSKYLISHARRGSSSVRGIPDGRAAALLAILAGLVGRKIMLRYFERAAFKKCSHIAAIPEHCEVPTVFVNFASENRMLHGCFVQVSTPDAPALCIFHGNSECLSEWLPVQTLLYAAGISSFVFDYSGYGFSSGRPTARNLRADAMAAYAHFRVATVNAAEHYVHGYSLGSGILLDVLNRLQPAPLGAVIAAGFSSARAAAIATGRVPSWLAWLLPNLWNNAARVRSLRVPLLLLHSRTDAVIPYSHSQHLARLARGANRLVTFEDLPHDAATNPAWLTTFWAPVIQYLHAGRLADLNFPAAHMNS